MKKTVEVEYIQITPDNQDEVREFLEGKGCTGIRFKDGVSYTTPWNIPAFVGTGMVIFQINGQKKLQYAEGEDFNELFGIL